MELAGVFEDERGVAEFSAGGGVGFGGGEAGLAFEIGAHGEMGLDLFGDLGVDARAPEQSVPEAVSYKPQDACHAFGDVVPVGFGFFQALAAGGGEFVDASAAAVFGLGPGRL